MYCCCPLLVRFVIRFAPTVNLYLILLFALNVCLLTFCTILNVLLVVPLKLFPFPRKIIIHVCPVALTAKRASTVIPHYALNVYQNFIYSCLGKIFFLFMCPYPISEEILIYLLNIRYIKSLFFIILFGFFHILDPPPPPPYVVSFTNSGKNIFI